MSDWYRDFANSGFGTTITRQLGLPRPAVLRRYEPGRAAAARARRHRLGGRGPAARAPSSRCSDAGARCSIAGHADGVRRREARRGHPRRHRPRRAGRSRCGARLPGPGTQAAARRPGGCWCWPTRPPDADSPAQAAARQALDGLVRSIGKELRAGVDGEPAVSCRSAPKARVASPLRFFLSGRSAYVDGQAVTLSAADIPAGEDPDRPLAGKVAVVTGAARGIGAAIARVHGPGRRARRRRRHPGGRAVARRRGQRRSAGRRCSSTSPRPTRPTRLIAHLRERHGGVDVVVHNAGITRDKLLVNMDAARWNSVLAVNLQAQLDITQALLDADGVLLGRRPSRLRELPVGHRRQPRSDQLRGVQGRRDRHGPGLGAGVRRARAATINAVAPGFIVTEMTAKMPMGTREVGSRHQLAAAGRPARRRRRDDRLARPAGQRRGQRADRAGLRPVDDRGVMVTHGGRPRRRRISALLGPGRADRPRPGRRRCPTTRLAQTGVARRSARNSPPTTRVCRYQLTDVLPVTYPHVLAFPLQLALMTDRSFPLALPGLVHVRNRIDSLAPDRRRRAA